MCSRLICSHSRNVDFELFGNKCWIFKMSWILRFIKQMVFFFLYIYIYKYYCLTVNTTMFFITLLYYSLLVSVILYNPHLNVRNALMNTLLWTCCRYFQIPFCPLESCLASFHNKNTVTPDMTIVVRVSQCCMLAVSVVAPAHFFWWYFYNYNRVCTTTPVHHRRYT